MEEMAQPLRGKHGARPSPPSGTGSAVVSPSNDLWVQRWLPVDRDPLMDVFGPDGVLKGTVVAPRDADLVGFGQGPSSEGVAYFVRTDEVGLQWLERYRIVWWSRRQFIAPGQRVGLGLPSRGRPHVTRPGFELNPLRSGYR